MYYTFVVSPHACQNFCEANPDCKGYVFLYTSVNICIGLRDLGSDEGIPASDLRLAMGIEDSPGDQLPVAMKRHS